MNASSQAGLSDRKVDFASVMRNKNFWFGVFLMTVGLAGYLGAADLDVGDLTRMGPGYIPSTLSIIIGAMGLILAIASTLAPAGERLESWAWFKLFLILGSIVAFSQALERLGLVIAVILVVAIAGPAASDRRWLQIALLGPVAALIAVLLFKMLLGLPLPTWPD